MSNVSTQDGVNINWSSNNDLIITNGGNVTRPQYGDGNANIILTATLTIGSESDTKEFNIVVLEDEISDIAEVVIPDGGIYDIDTANNRLLVTRSSRLYSVNLSTISSDTTGIDILGNNSDIWYGGEFSPDGNDIFFVDGTNGNRIYKKDLLTDVITQMTSVVATSPIISPDNTTLYYQNWGVYKMNLSNSVITKVTDKGANHGMGIAISPDNSQIVYVSSDDNNALFIKGVNEASSVVGRQLTIGLGGYSGLKPKFTSDGEYIYYRDIGNTKCYLKKVSETDINNKGTLMVDGDCANPIIYNGYLYYSNGNVGYKKQFNPNWLY